MKVAGLVSAVVGLALIAAGCGDDAGSPARPDPSVDTTADTDSGAPDPESLPEAAAPHGLGEVDLPRTGDDVVALFDRLPSNLGDRRRTAAPPTQARVSASYGSTEPVGCASVGLQAVDVSTGDFFPEGWTAELVIAMFTTGADWTVEDFGRDGELAWLLYTTTCGVEGEAGEDVVSTLNWGAAGSPWVFSASADSPDLRDELTRSFVAAAE